jgi:large subunit ribosomal protein L35
MLKVKTKKAATKRYKLTKNNKVLIKKTGKAHIMTKKSSKRKRHLRKGGQLKKCEVKRIKTMMPY